MRFFSRRRAKEQEERPEAFVSAIIVAAGQSRRMGGDTSKQFILIDGVPVIVRTLKVPKYSAEWTCRNQKYP